MAIALRIRQLHNNEIDESFERAVGGIYHNYRYLKIVNERVDDIYGNEETIKKLKPYVAIKEYNASKDTRKIKNKKFCDYYLETGKSPLKSILSVRTKDYKGQLEVRKYNNNRLVLSGDYLNWCKKFVKPIQFSDKVRFMSIIKTCEEFQSNYISNYTKYKKNCYDAKKRAYQKFLDMAICNDFDMFFTLTFSSKSMPSCTLWDIEKATAMVDNFFKGIKRKDDNFKYMVCADIGNKEGEKKHQRNHKKRKDKEIKLFREYDNSQRLHFHGLCTYSDYLYIKESVNNLGENIKFNDENVYYFASWQNGFSECQRIQDRKACACYSAKYVIKCGLKMGLSDNAPRYHCSKGLKVPVVHYIGLDDRRLQEYINSNIELCEDDFISSGGFYTNLILRSKCLIERLSKSIVDYYRKKDKRISKIEKVGGGHLCVKRLFYA